VKTIRALLRILSDKNRSLEEMNHILEERVQQRTAELENANARLREITLQDDLTKLPNRRFALSSIEYHVELWKRYGTVFSILFIEIDKFKQINDSFGHDKGDELLAWTAAFLRANLRQVDILCRYGGDEFIAICPESTGKNALSAGQTLLAHVRSENTAHPNPFWTLSLSVGAAEISSQCATLEDLIKAADGAMYRIKSKGGNGIILG